MQRPWPPMPRIHAAYDAAWAAHANATATWEATTEARYKALDAAIERYNDTIDNPLMTRWTQYDVCPQPQPERSGQFRSGADRFRRCDEHPRSRPAQRQERILAGGALTGDLANL